MVDAPRMPFPRTLPACPRLIGLLVGLSALAAETTAKSEFRSFGDWQATAGRLPSNRALQGSPVPSALLPLPRYGEFGEVVTAFFQQCRIGTLGKLPLWHGEAPQEGEFFNTDTAYFLSPQAPTTALIQNFLRDGRKPATTATLRFQPFAQKIELPEGSEVFMHADLHGDLRSLLADLAWLNEQGYLEGFRIRRPNFHMVFFGDYADRGQYGVEVLYTLLRLKLANPDQCFLGRGNHEEVSLAARYGFLSEGRMKYGADFDPKAILRAFDFLPVVIYFGSHGEYIEAHHGGLEPGFDPRGLLDAPGPQRFQFLGTLNQKQFLAAHPDWFGPADAASRQAYSQYAQDFRPEDPINPTVLGFMWNDFTLATAEPGFANDPGRAFVYGQAATRFVLAQTRTPKSAVRAIFRGHQQSASVNPMMRRLVASRGIFRHWQAADSPARYNAGIPELTSFLEHGPERSIPPDSVWTLNISPDTAYGQVNGYTYDTFGIVKTAGKLEDWRLRVVNVEVTF